jgi:hypothetical protein
VLDPADLLAAWDRGRTEAPLSRALTLAAAAAGRSVEDAAVIDVGSRDVLLAALLAPAAGVPLWTTTDCDGCGERLDVPVDVTEVARLPVYEPGEVFETSVGGRAVHFRLPCTADLAELPGGDVAGARRSLLERCVRWTGGELPSDVADAVELAMESAAPAGAVEVAVHCGGCGAVTEAGLDVPALLWAEVEGHALRLVQEVHVLAGAYGWSEAEVLRLSPLRRAAYLELVRA